MAEGESKPSQTSSELGSQQECAVCLQTCIHPAQLPCGHVFCFLCVKGIVSQSRKCAMCRREIPRDYLQHPALLDVEAKEEGFDGGYQWFYEGRNGWWQYDERTSKELENSYKAGERICELQIAGFLYIADFDSMLQLRRNDPSRRRRIKRDLSTIPKKGIAGIKMQEDQTIPDRSETPPLNEVTGTSTPIPPSNTPQTPVEGNAQVTPDNTDIFNYTLSQIQALSLRDFEVTGSDTDDDATVSYSLPWCSHLSKYKNED